MYTPSWVERILWTCGHADRPLGLCFKDLDVGEGLDIVSHVFAREVVAGIAGRGGGTTVVGGDRNFIEIYRGC